MAAFNGQESSSPGVPKRALRDRALLVGWSAAFVVLMILVAFALGSLFLRHQTVFAVRFLATPATSCWDVLIQIDGRIVSPEGSPEWRQCGDSPARLVDLGACRNGISVRGDAQSHEPLSELSVELLRNEQVSAMVTWDTSRSTIHVHTFACGT